MRRFVFAGVLVSAVALWSVQAQEALPSNTERLLKAALDAQIRALNSENPAGVMALFHPDAPNLKQTQQGLVGMFRSYDLKYTIDSKHYVGTDLPYAYIRVVQTTAGAKLKPSQTEQLFVFKRNGKSWAFWTSVVLNKRAIPSRR